MEDNTRYCITTSKNCRDDDGQQSKGKKWIKIAFDSQHDTTITHYNHALSNERVAKQSAAITSTKEESNNNNNAPNEHEEEKEIPASVLQYQRQKRKMQAANRASKTHVTISQHLQTIYTDEHIVVTNKPSGILCVPGVNSNKSLLDLVFEMYGASEEELEALAAAAAEEANRGEGETKAQKRRRKNMERNSQTSTPDFSVVTRDNMIVHRLDMDTSGIVMFARNRHAMSKLHEAFRQKDTGSTRKVYEALLVGWLDVDCWIDVASSSSSSSSVGEKGGDDDDNIANNNQEGDNNTDYIGGGEINLPLQRDHKHPPFMRVSTPHSEAEAHQAVADLNHAGYKKLIAKRPKASVTQFRVVKHELWMGHKVTRVELYPVTGRTHQLRVHCAALGHPILGDPAYGYYGEANPNGGFSNTMIRSISPTYATMELRDNVEKSVKESGRTMCLHAKELSLNHPVTGEWVSFSAAPSF
eukprot:scaffold23141_cov133-Skeletonema_marinoi.AAC.2